ncbi:MAG: hypothetical protein ACRD3E_11940 [Terriglobales bacterium]
MSGSEARHLLAPWVQGHRRVNCLFGSPEFSDAGCGVLWSLDANLLTIRRDDGPEASSVDLHIPFEDVTVEYFEAGEAPNEIRPARPIEWFDAALYLCEPELSEAGAAIELRWAVWIGNSKWDGKRSAAACSAS